MFLLILISSLTYLFFSVRRIKKGKIGIIIASLLLVGSLFSVLFRSHPIFAFTQVFFVVWVCQAIFLFLIVDLFRIGFKIIKRKNREEKKISRLYQIVFFMSLILTGIFIWIGTSNNLNYKTRYLTLELSKVKEPFTAAFFTDLHLSPLFQREKLERLAAELKEIQPDFILFGGDLADSDDKELTAMGYDSLFQKLTAAAKIGAFGVSGNHEAYMTKKGSEPLSWLLKNGMIVLDDSTVCTPLACFSGRKDYQMVKLFDEERKPLEKLAKKNTQLPWILLDHQPRGLDSLGKQTPDIALSGHTHAGQFFPGTFIISIIWKLSYGEGIIDNTRWLVSSGIDSWGPPVRIGSDTELLILKFVPKKSP